VAWLYSLLTFLQPGILWPALQPYKPMLIVGAIAMLVGVSAADKSRSKFAAFGTSIFAGLCIFLLAQVASVHYSGFSSIVNEAFYWDAYLLFVVGAVLLINSEAALKRFVSGMIVGGMVVVAYGIYSIPSGLSAQMGHAGRAGAYGMYENHNDYTFVIILILPFIFMYSKMVRSIPLRVVLSIMAIMCVGGVLLSLSRGGILALVLEGTLITILYFKGGKRLAILSLVAVLGTSAVLYQWAARAANQGDYYTAQDAQNSRFELWRAGQAMVMRHPLLGVGSRRFGEFSLEYADISHDERGKNSHNTYIEVLATSGVIGFFGFATLLVSMIVSLRKPLLHLPWVDSLRLATLVSLASMMFRAVLDAKPHDWGFYALCAITMSIWMLGRASKSAVSFKVKPEETAADPYARRTIAERDSIRHTPLGKPQTLLTPIDLRRQPDRTANRARLTRK
jgi:O-antigen ligase